MIKKIISSLSIILMLGSDPISIAYANSNSDFRGIDFTGGIGFDSKLNGLQQFAVKKDASYDESKDPALRKGTENWEEPQGSFFAIPAVVSGSSHSFCFSIVKNDVVAHKNSWVIPMVLKL